MEITISKAGGCIEMPMYHMRGGTSTGIVLYEKLVPKEMKLREELLRRIMGVPLSGKDDNNRQITGLGRSVATSNKVFLADIRKTDDGKIQLVSTLAQLASTHSDIDWSVNCGNMSSALQLWALDAGFLTFSDNDTSEVEIYNTNTGISTVSRMMLDEEMKGFEMCAIAGVPGLFPRVDLILQDPVGNYTHSLLPTRKVIDKVEIAGGHPIEISCVDVAVPMVIVDAASLGKTGKESMAELNSDKAFLDALRHLWIEGGILMKLKKKEKQMTRDDLANSETIPKICIVSQPEKTEKDNITVRYFTPQTAHSAMAVSGGCCLAAACIIPGTIAHRLARNIDTSALNTAKATEIQVSIEHPVGSLDAVIKARLNKAKDGNHLEITSAAYLRSAQILIRGHVPIYRASSELASCLLGISQSLEDGTANVFASDIVIE